MVRGLKDSFLWCLAIFQAPRVRFYLLIRSAEYSRHMRLSHPHLMPQAARSEKQQRSQCHSSKQLQTKCKWILKSAIYTFNSSQERATSKIDCLGRKLACVCWRKRGAMAKDSNVNTFQTDAYMNNDEHLLMGRSSRTWKTLTQPEHNIY